MAKAVSATGLARSAPKTAATMSLQVAAEQLLDVGVHQQHDQEDAADHRHPEDDL